MAEQQANSQSVFKEQLDKEVIARLQNPIIFRIVVLALIGIVGLGSMGVPIYLHIGTLQEKDQVQRSKKILIERKEEAEVALKAYKARLSPNIRYIQWLSEIRDLALGAGLKILNLDPKPVITKDKNEIQRLIVTASLEGSYDNIVQFIGTVERRKYGLCVDEIRLNPADKNINAVLQLAMLLQPMSKSEAKKGGNADSQADRPDLLAGKFNLNEKPAAKPGEAAGTPQISTAAPGAAPAPAGKPAPAPTAQSKPGGSEFPLPGPGGKFELDGNDYERRPAAAPQNGVKPPPAPPGKRQPPDREPPGGKFSLPDNKGAAR
ncbi:MAG: hypothetical protein PHW69_05630 [Elusimicrobiaceae bacterium]|nr:hypothetical protein [Elusimicrobiaceae bacterium]